MPWLKLLHMSAVIIWCGALLYLPGAVAASSPVAAAGTASPFGHGGPRVLRGVFTLVATPAALVAIASGTAIFVLLGPLAPWLVAKLALVGALVLGHGACGMLILRLERQATGHLRAWSMLIVAWSLTWLLGIAWLVLRKPF